MTDASDEDVQRWLARIQASKGSGVDLSRDEDLSIALMNLISLEEHFFFTAQKTGDGKYFDMLASVRELRKTLLAKIVADPQGEEWCISKHLLAASMRLMEVGTKELAKDRAAAESLFSSAFQLWSLFFAINLKMVEPKSLSKGQRAALDKAAKNAGAKDDASEGQSGGHMDKISAIIKKIVDCCKEW